MSQNTNYKKTSVDVAAAAERLNQIQAINGNGMSIPLTTNSLKNQISQEKDFSRNKTSLKHISSTARDDYTPRETIKTYKKESLILPSPLRVKNYLRIKKPNSIVDDKSYEESKLPTVNYTSMTSAVKSGEEKFRQTSLGGTTNKFRG